MEALSLKLKAVMTTWGQSRFALFEDACECTVFFRNTLCNFAEMGPLVKPSSIPLDTFWISNYPYL